MKVVTNKIRMESLNFFVLFGLLAQFYPHSVRSLEKCSTDSNVCKPIEECSILQNPVLRGFRQKLCSIDGRVDYMCCSTEIQKDQANDQNKTQTISETMCSKYLEEVCPRYTPYIIGGNKVPATKYPFMAIIGREGPNKNIRWYCGGSLISHNFVLSAAHCTRQLKTAQGWAGLGFNDKISDLSKPESQILKIIQYITHPNYKTSIFYYDISLLRLEKNLQFNEYIRPICLYQSHSINTHMSTIATGWGITESGRSSSSLQEANLEIYNINKCNVYKKIVPEALFKGLDKESQICAGRLEGNRDTCSGDSGGPLFLQSTKTSQSKIDCVLLKQIGVTSFGSMKCGLKNSPGVYTKVAVYREWIEWIVWKN